MALPTLDARWGMLALMFFVRATVAIHFQSLPPLAPFLVAGLGLSYARLGMLLGVFMFAGIFLSLPGGVLGQRWGSRAVLLWGLGLMTLGALVLAAAPRFAEPFAVAVAGRLLGGVGGVLVIVQLTRAVADWFAGRELATAMAVQLSGWPFGIALVVASLGAVAERISWQGAVLLTAALSALAWLLMLALYRDAPLPLTVAHPAPDAAQEGKPAERRAAAGGSLPPRAVGLLVAAGAIWMIWNLNYIAFISFAPLMLIAGGRSIAGAGLAVSLVSWLSLAFVPLGGWLIDRTGRANLLMTVAMLGTAALTVLLTTGRWVLPLILAMGVVRGPVAGGINALPTEVVGPRHRSTGFGIYFTVYYLGMALLPPVAGWLQDRAGTAVAPVLFAAGCAVLCVPALAVFRSLQRRWTPRESPALAPSTAR